ncbi:MAG: UDP-glucose 4-epimerase GalE [Firmicutes bacterium]|nr:UDP-glucose 4-epimerase GalE [Bacillota bacterium]MCL1953970.1 UDP-glucose 4-epimerase GalE [Bacillota bacterium]
MTILVTGGLGYIGSHVVVELLNLNHSVVVVDNLVNSDIGVKSRIEQIAGREIVFCEVDLCDRAGLTWVFDNHKIDCVVHFAALKAVGESVEKPLKYYQNNIGGMINLLSVMHDHGVNKLVFSSSATVYGIPKTVPIKETSDIKAINPYGQTKVVCEQIVQDYAASNPNFGVINLRYFNPVGAHSSLLIGENPKGIPNNLMPVVCNVAIGKQDKLKIFGHDYDTIDGTCVRDYVHVVDLALGHVSALKWVMNNSGVEFVNLGTGKGATVMEVVQTFEQVTGVKVPFEIVGRRAGDATEAVASTDKAKKLLAWQSSKGLADMCRDHLGYAKNATN